MGYRKRADFWPTLYIYIYIAVVVVVVVDSRLHRTIMLTLMTMFYALSSRPVLG